MEKFDINRYKKMELKRYSSETDCQYTSDDKDVIIGNAYHDDIDKHLIQVEEIEKKAPYYFHIKVYSFDTKMLFFYEKRLWGMPIGITKQYDEKSNTMQEINNEEGYNFPPKKLVKKIEADFNIKLGNGRDVHLSRYFEEENNKHIYKILFMRSEGGSSAIKNNPVWALLYDGNTGELLYKIGIKDKFKGNIQKRYKDFLKGIEEEVETEDKKINVNRRAD